MTINAVVFDLDGVIRHWDPGPNADIEWRNGLAPGAILDAAFSADLGIPAITGGLTYEEWTAAVAERIGSPEAVAEWSEHRGTLDPEMKGFVAEVRATGCTVGLLSNATTRLHEDLAHLGLADSFDIVFNTAQLGVCKPDHAVYERVLELLDLPGDEVVFTDDLPDWAEAATEVGLHGIPFVGLHSLRAALQQLGVPVV